MAESRVQSELLFHNQQAQERSATFRTNPTSLVFDDALYLDHETWIRPAFAKLGDVAGRSVLDFGCGHGMAAIVLARRGARVTAFDLSCGYLAEANDRAAANDVTIQFVQADGEKLPFVRDIQCIESKDLARALH